MKRTIEIEDTLDETVECVKEEVLDHFIEYLEEHPMMTDFDEYYQDSGCDAIHEIVDTSTPIYNSEIDGLYYLYSNEFDEAYENAGIGNGTEDNHKQVTIYCYLEQKAYDYQNELQEKFKDYIEDRSEDISVDDDNKPLKNSIKEFIDSIKDEFKRESEKEQHEDDEQFRMSQRNMLFGQGDINAKLNHTKTSQK